MAVTKEALQHLVGEMHKMQSDSLANLTKQQKKALAVLVGRGRGNSGLTDTRVTTEGRMCAQHAGDGREEAP